MARYPDVLDLLGKTPREYGGVHVHLEALSPAGQRRYVVSVLVQAAFEPPPPATLVFFRPEAEHVYARVTVPPLADGRVLRLRVPFSADVAVERVRLRVDTHAPRPGAMRVRPAWKLHDVLESPRLSELEAGPTPGVLRRALKLAASVAVSSVVDDALNLHTDVTPPRSATLTVHAARGLPPQGVECEGADVPPLDSLAVEVLWREGEPLPAPPDMQRQPQPPPSATRRCVSCAFEGPAAEYARARACPSCDAPWY